MKQIFQNIYEYSIVAAAALGTFFAPIAGVLLAVGFAIGLDLIVAYWRTKAKKLKWTSRQMGRGLIPKFIGYQAAIILLFLIDKFVLNDFITLFTTIQFLLTKLGAMTLIYVEALSMNESFKVVKGKGLFDYFVEMLTIAKNLKTHISEINEHKKELEPTQEPIVPSEEQKES